jgi:alpha-beta hydrolase superfamily lysophospholipase
MKWLSRYVKLPLCLLGIMFLFFLVSCYPLQDSFIPAQSQPVHLEDIAHLRCAYNNFDLSQWQFEQRERLYPPENRTTWMVPKDGWERAVAVLVHGLNGKPNRMNAIAYILNEVGVRVLRVTLRGHGCLDIHDLQVVRMEDWFYDLQRAYCIALHYANEHDLPLYYVGYSAGGGLILDLMQRKLEENILFDKMIFFAPGISLSIPGFVLSRIVLSLNTIWPIAHWSSSLLVPSITPEEYRCYIGTPLAAYNARLHAMQHLETIGLERLDNIPTIIFIDPQDELVSKTGIQKMIQKAGMKNWEIIEINKKRSQFPHHLIIDPVSTGDEQWGKIVKSIKCHLFDCMNPIELNGP